LGVGILGGAFNPPHIGHLVCAQEALVQLELDVVTLVPVGEAPHREIEQDPGPEARLEMCELAVRDDERLAVSRIEIDRSGPSYTVDTLRELRARSGDVPVLVLGGDQAATLRDWREPEEILRLATVAVAERTGWERGALAERLAPLPGAELVRFFPMPRIDVSSTLVRRRAARGEPIRYLVPDRVASYIVAGSLYDSAAPVTAD
jgi:nicotinate-nucleotide adenylyltransferase